MEGEKATPLAGHISKQGRAALTHNLGRGGEWGQLAQAMMVRSQIMPCAVTGSLRPETGKPVVMQQTK